ncbi:ankyrin repeat and socs box protein [Aspergillus flavus]|nr:ankyrin repeat and socs box protein [Aspergillus flavus]
MALEAIGTASAILTLAESSVGASLKLYQFFTTIRDAPREITSISRDIKNFNTLAKNLKTALESQDVRTVVDKDPQIKQALNDLLDPLNDCHQACLQIQERAERHFQPETSVDQTSDGNSKVHRIKRIKSGYVTWYFRRGEVFSLISRFQLTKGVFSDAMGSLTLLLSFRTSIMISKDPNTTHTSGKSQLDNSANSWTNSLPTQKRKFDDDAGSAIIEYVERLSNIAPSPSIVPSLYRRETPSDPKYINELLDAVRRGTVATVEMILNHVDIDARDPCTGRTALSIAAELGDRDMTKLLLIQGASVNIRQYSLSSYCFGRPAMASGRFPLHWAIAGNHIVVAELLLQYGANPNARNSPGRSALQEACMRSDLKMVRLLLQYGADVNARSYNHGWAPIHEAANDKPIEILQLLLEYEPVLDVPAVFEPHAPGAAPLHLAVRSHSLDALRLLLSSGADPDALMVEDMTALHLAAAMGWVEGITVLLDAGASINARDACTRETPIHKAARNIKMDAIGILGARGADTEIKNIDGQNYQTLLECARRSPDDWRVDPLLGSYCTFY